VVGTPQYMSPEQARADKVDARTDLFSLGVVLYQMATGTVPFIGPRAADTLTAVERTDPPAPIAVIPDLPTPLSDLIVRLLAKAPADRPASAEEVADELSALEAALSSATNLVAIPVASTNDPWVDLDADEPSTAGDVIPTRHATRPVSPRPVRVWVTVLASVASACVLIALVGAVILKFTRPQPTDDPSDEPNAKKDPPGGPRPPREQPVDVKLPAGLLPPPDEAELAAAVKRARDRFATQYARKEPEEQFKLGSALDAAANAAHPPADRFALRLEARDAFAAAGAIDEAFGACDRLAEEFVVDLPDLKAAAAAACLKGLDPLPAGDARAAALRKLSTRATEAARAADVLDAPTPVTSLLTTAHTAAERAPLPDLVGALKNELAEARGVVRALAGDAEPATALAVGKRLAVRGDRWPEAIRLLTQGSEGTWRDAAAGEAPLAAPRSDPAAALTRLDFSRGQPADGPIPGRDEHCEWNYTASALSLKVPPGGGFCPHPIATAPHDCVIEIRARGTGPTGEAHIDPLSYGVSGIHLKLDQLGTIRIDGWGGQNLLPRAFSHRAIRKQGEWNVLVLVIRNNRMDLYANGEVIAYAIPLPPVPARVAGKRLFLGAVGGAEYGRVTVWKPGADEGPNPNAAVAAGDRWWAAAAGEPDPKAQSAARRRAAHWYSLALDHLADSAPRRDELRVRIQQSHLIPNLDAQKPVLRLDYSAGPAVGGPGAYTDPEGRFWWKLTRTAWVATGNYGMWWTTVSPVPQDAAIEITARVTSEKGSWAFNPFAHRVADNTDAGVVLSVNHLGVLTIFEFKTGKAAAEFPVRTIRHHAINKRTEWNTLLVVTRNERMDVYANGELVASDIPLWNVPKKSLLVGIRSAGPAEVEYQRITVWDLSAPPKK
jgi:hypothetical protein